MPTNAPLLFHGLDTEDPERFFKLLELSYVENCWYSSDVSMIQYLQAHCASPASEVLNKVIKESGWFLTYRNVKKAFLEKLVMPARKEQHLNSYLRMEVEL